MLDSNKQMVSNIPLLTYSHIFFSWYLKIDPGWPLCDLRPQQWNALCLRFFWPTLVVIGHSLAYWPLVDPDWLLHDLWPQQCKPLDWSWVLQPKFGSHIIFLCRLKSGWPWKTPTWSLTLAVLYALVISYELIWWS